MTSEIPAPPLEILVVDDNEDDVLLLQESLRDLPTVSLVHAVHDGEEALTFLRREGQYAGTARPALVLLDINMPKKNGFEVLAEMKNDPLLRTIPVVMLTTSNRDADVMAAYGSGACSFVTKPVNFDRLKLIAEHFVCYWTMVVQVPRCAPAVAAGQEPCPPQAASGEPPAPPFFSKSDSFNQTVRVPSSGRLQVMADGLNPQPIEILLVDDNDDDVVLLEESFKDSRFLNLLQVVHDGHEALAYLRREEPYKSARTPGLVLLDINMPKMNGFEVLQAMKADPQLRTIPVVMLTTSTRDEDVARSYDGGACSFVSKPVNLEKLKEVIKQFALYWTLVSVVPQPRPSTEPKSEFA